MDTFQTHRHTDTKWTQSLKIYFAYSIVKIVSIENEKSVLTSTWLIHTKNFTQTILGINVVDLKINIYTTFMYLFLNICIKLNIRFKPDTFSWQQSKSMTSILYSILLIFKNILNFTKHSLVTGLMFLWGSTNAYCSMSGGSRVVRGWSLRGVGVTVGHSVTGSNFLTLDRLVSAGLWGFGLWTM